MSHKLTARRLLAPLDCARPASAAQRMVCRSPMLLADDHRMARAYAEALRDGASPRGLRRDQVRWVYAREAAAHRSRYAVDALYRRRIADLEWQPRGVCARGGSRRAGLASVTHWLLSVPKKIVSPRDRAGCG